MTLDELHRKALFYGSAAMAGVLLEVLTSPGFHLRSPHYITQNVAGQVCYVDKASGTFAPSPDGMPVCYSVPVKKKVRNGRVR